MCFFAVTKVQSLTVLSCKEALLNMQKPKHINMYLTSLRTINICNFSPGSAGKKNNKGQLWPSEISHRPTIQREKVQMKVKFFTKFC